MEISEREVSHIAALSRLLLSGEEKEVFQKQLSGILLYVDKLNEIDTDNVEPVSHVLKMDNVFREDGLRVSLDLEDALVNAPERSGNFYRVPKIID